MAPQFSTDGTSGVGDLGWANNAVYQAAHVAIEAIEKAYDVMAANAPADDVESNQRVYASKATAKLSVFEVASRAISVMAVVPPEKKATIAATAIATIRQIQLS